MIALILAESRDYRMSDAPELDESELHESELHESGLQRAYRFYKKLLEVLAVVSSVLTVIFFFIGVGGIPLAIAGTATTLLLLIVLLGRAFLLHSEPVSSIGAWRQDYIATPKPISALKAPERVVVNKPQPNLKMLGPPRLAVVHCDDNFVFREYTGPGSTPHRLAIVQDFQNKLEVEREIKSIRGVMSQLTVSDTQRKMSRVFNRGFWLGEKYTATNFERGDTRTLLIALAAKPQVVLGIDQDTPTIEVLNNRCESEDRCDPPQPWQFSTWEPLKVTVVLFTQSRERFHKEGEIQITLGRDDANQEIFNLQITKPL